MSRTENEVTDCIQEEMFFFSIKNLKKDFTSSRLQLKEKLELDFQHCWFIKFNQGSEH